LTGRVIGFLFVTNLKNMSSASLTTIDLSSLQLGKELGRGNFSVVYKGELHGEEVAVKKLNEYDIQRTQLEVAILGEVASHPNCIALRGTAQDVNSLFVVTELAAGRNLRDALQGRSFTVAERIQLALDTARGVAHVHSIGVVHRDIKTENILLNNGQAKLADFGFARRVEVGEMSFCGTEEFTAPEVEMQEAYDERADIFSLGVVFAELFAPNFMVPGREFLNRHPSSWFAADMDEIDRVLAAVPASLLKVVKRCLHDDATQCISAQECVEALEAVLLAAEPEETIELMRGEMLVEVLPTTESTTRHTMTTTARPALKLLCHVTGLCGIGRCEGHVIAVTIHSLPPKSAATLRQKLKRQATTVGRQGLQPQKPAVDLLQKLKPPSWQLKV
jgi:serine/threonine protein kinase